MNILQGKVLGNRYTLIEKIGDGGMALVYKAKCELLNRFVAVKILRPEFTTDEEFIKKFKRESLAAASLSHPNVVGIYDVGEEDGIYYIIMEYVSGKTLKEYIKENGKLNYRETLNIANQIAFGLDHAHKNGVVHRDVKPHNILVTEDKIIKVTDFGIARAASSSTMTNTGSIMGSVHYFSPEQARGGYTDHRTDIYSLGVVIYEMLTGSLPYDAESPVTVALKHIQEDFVEPTLVDNSIPAAVNDIVVKSMEKDMANRYQTIREIIEDIDIARNNPYEKIIHKQNVSQFTQTIPLEEIDEALNKKNKPKEKSKKKKTAIIVISVLAILVAITSLTIYGYNKYFIVKDVKIPNIIGMQEKDGAKLLELNKLIYVPSESQSSDKPVGTIINCSPDQGSTVKENSEVKVTISSGLEKVLVPDLSNQTISNAISMLSAAKLIKGTTERKNSDTVPKNLIISQNPLPNSQVDIGSSIDIVLSDGPLVKIVVVPQIIGKTLEEATADLENAHLKLGEITTEYDSNFSDNVVTSMNIEEGTQVAENSVINITLNKLDVPPEPQTEQ